MKYNWTYASIGGNTRVKIQSGEDIRHLGELDEKLWTVLSCPVAGLEIAEESLKMVDISGDGRIHVQEVVATADWLCSVLRTPQVLLSGNSRLDINEIADDNLRATAAKIGKDGVVTIEQVNEAMANVSVPVQSAPEAPYTPEVMDAYKVCQDAYSRYFATSRLQDLGLATLPADAPVPGMKEDEFREMGAKIAAY